MNVFLFNVWYAWNMHQEGKNVNTIKNLTFLLALHINLSEHCYISVDYPVLMDV